MADRQFKIESRYTVKEVGERLERFYGIISATAKSLGVHRDSLTRYLKRHPEAWEAFKMAKEALLDRAEVCLIKAMDNQEEDPKSALDAAKFILQFHGGEERGYTNKQKVEVTGKDGEALLPQVVNIHPVEVVNREADENE